MKNKKLNKQTDNFFLKLTDKTKSYFFKGTKINPLKIFTISSQFKQLVIKDEDLLVPYSFQQTLDKIDEVIYI